MRGFPSLGQIASAVWGLVAVASRTVEVNTKTGFSLTAGSYSVRASSTQESLITIANTAGSNTAAISSVTTTRAVVTQVGPGNGAVTAFTDALVRTRLTDSTTLTASRSGTTTDITVVLHTLELF